LCSSEVYMQLEGQAYDKHWLRSGKYTKANDLSSEIPYWIESGGTYALWFVKGHWMLGEKSDLGEDTGYLHGTSPTLCPESIGSNWKYADGGQFLDAQGNAKMFKYEENSCSNEVYMQLKGRAKYKQGSNAGKYTKANDLSSGMPYWTSTDGTKALWFVEGRWRIGPRSHLRTITQGIHSTFSPPCPESVGSHWKYVDDGEFVDAQGNAKMFQA